MMKDVLRVAFEDASLGFSPDRVVADPEMRSRFVLRCREAGLDAGERELNRRLLNLRKSGGLRGRKSKRTTFNNEDQYRFASEMAARFIERRDAVSLDGIMCDPLLASEFDQLAAQLAPGFSPLEYRWAALNLRKKQQLKPELLSRVIQAKEVERFELSVMDLARVSVNAGLYEFFTTDRVLYVGESEHLQNRIRKHLDHSDNKDLARWLWSHDLPTLHLETHILPPSTSTRMRRALESEMILSRNPVFNVKR